MMQLSSMVSKSRINGKKESSDFCSGTVANLKGERYETDKFKGVVPQQNGHWGAQIYANHQRIWLGTFKSEREAAMAYDSATIKLRNGESHRNFPWNDQTVQEPMFQRHYAVETILSMIKDGSYPSRFASFLSASHEEGEGCGRIMSISNEEGSQVQVLFQKELTPSDVGKLNRLVIPKKYAVTYFPYVGGAEANDQTVGGCNVNVELEVVLYDKLMRMWKFRYCYWKSSQSYVFTRGWNRFVKDKKLKAKDIIAFYTCWRKGGELEPFSMIDVIYNDNVDEGEMGNKIVSNNNNTQKGLKLFGVCIN